MFKKIIQFTILSLLFPYLVGCGTILSGASSNGLSFYSGTKHDFSVLQQGGIPAVLATIDLPLSFVLDTLLLPVTLSK